MREKEKIEREMNGDGNGNGENDMEGKMSEILNWKCLEQIYMIQ